MNRISSKAIIAQTRTTFGIPVDEADAIEWIAECINAIGYHVGFVNKYACISVDNYTIQQPVDYNSLNYFLYNGQKLHKGQLSSFQVSYSESPETTALMSLIEARDKVVFNEGISGEGSFDALDDMIMRQATLVGNSASVSKQWYYYEEDECWKTNVEGNVIMFYKALPVDKEGYPLVDDDHWYRQALVYYVLRASMIRGLVHPVLAFKDIEMLTTKYIGKASNQGAKMNADQKQTFIDNWTGIYRELNGY